MSVKNVMRAVAGTAVVLLATGAAGPGVAAVVTADSGDVQATVRKTVLQTGNAQGEIATSRMYTQVSAVGNGTKTVTVPVGVTSNRNLNEFGAFPMEGESIVFDLTVSDGAGIEERTLTDADINPIAVSVKVMLDGVEVAPEDLVGANGVLDVEYTVRNTTARTAPMTFTDVEGNEVTEDVETADPFAGSLDVILPQGFNEITAPGATVAGNGQNATQLGYTFLLFPPLGSAEVKVGYQSRISNGQMPAAEFSFLPLVPYENSTIAGTTEALKGGASTGASIFDAGTQIGDNLLKLQEGAGKLVAGLGQLSAGASQLSDGLVNTAAPGSAALADGANQVADGLNQLNSNVPALEEGVSDLNAGAQTLNGGAEQVAKGNAGLNDGLTLYYEGIEELPATVKEGLESNADYQKLLGALDGIVKGIGSATTPDTLLNGVARVTAGIGTSPACDPATGANCGLLQVIGGLQQRMGCSSAAAASPCTYVVENPDTPGVPDPIVVQQTLVKMVNGIGSASTDGTLLNGMKRIELGLSNPACDPKTGKNCGIQQAAAGVAAGIPVLVDGILANVQDALLAPLGVPTPGCDPTETLRCASATLASGAAQVADGTEQLAEGTETLNGRVPTLASGVAQLDDGAGQVADGADQLAEGLGAAADGSGQLADGLAQAEPGGAQIEDGAGQLKEQGADELAKTGKEAQLDYARRVAMLEAAQQAGEEGVAIPFGPAEGTDVVTTAAYKMELAGITAEEENTALKYGMAVLLLIAGGLAGVAGARRIAG